MSDQKAEHQIKEALLDRRRNYLSIKFQCYEFAKKIIKETNNHSNFKRSQKE